MFHSPVKRSDLSAQSLLHKRYENGDFLDCFSVESELSPRRAAEIITAFPAWTMALVRLRGALVAPFGLSSKGPEAADKLGIFPVEYDGEAEVIAGFNDRHLDFRVSVLSENGRISLATWVHRHNLGGWLYLAAILPFHILIARNALARVKNASAEPKRP